jgi:CubicO group peptidase (beta-lactamase class C family)
MADPCKPLEDELKTLRARRAALSKQQSDDVGVGSGKGPPNPENTKDAKALDEQIRAVSHKLDDCRDHSQVHVEGLEFDGLEALDDIVRRFMRRNNVRAGQLTISKAGFPVLRHAYTFGGADYPRTQVTSLLRIASCSKAFTCGAIDELCKDPSYNVELGTKVFPLLGMKPALRGAFHDDRLDTITIQHLVDHEAGWNCHDPLIVNSEFIAGTRWDPVFHIRDIAREMGNLSEPPTKRQIAQYMYGKKLQFTPGSQSLKSTNLASYSNFGYVVLGLVVEHVTGKPFVQYLREAVLAPIGINDVFVAPMMSKTKDPREVTYDAPGEGPSALEPMLAQMVPNAYGGAGFITELMDAGGGLMCTATSMAMYAKHRAVWGLDGRVEKSRRGGMPGSASYMVSTSRDIDWAFVFNSRPGDNDDIASQLSDDLQKTMGELEIPTPRPQFTR